jgi:tripartite-type tricarboxylate transporter receptor subunit TctC
MGGSGTSPAGLVAEVGVGGAARILGAPEIPTAVESGLPGMISQNFIGLFAPAKTPKDIVERIAQASHTVMADRELQQLFIASGFEPILDAGPEQMRRFLEEDIARWTPIIKAIGLKLD